MTHVIESPLLYDLIKRYLTGESIQKLADEIGVSNGVLRQRFKKMNVVLHPRRRSIPADMVERYLAGESEQALAKAYGVSRIVIRRRLLEEEIEPRNKSAAMITRWERAGEAERHALLNPAHVAAKGRSVSTVEKIKRAKTRELNQIGIVHVEQQLADYLAHQGLVITQQKAIGPYNIDITCNEASVAVEIFGGSWHNGGGHAARFIERSKYILNAGWSLLIIWVDGRRHPLTITGMAYTAVYMELHRRDPSMIGEYRVITGTGQLPPATKSYLNTRAIVERLRSG